MEIPERVKTEIDKKVFVHLATIMPDGSPQISVVWVDRDGDKILFSSAEGRVKTDNIRRDNRVALSFTTEDDYENIVMRGRVTRFEADGWWLIDQLAKKYLGKDTYPWKTPGQVRVNAVVEIDRITGNR